MFIALAVIMLVASVWALTNLNEFGLIGAFLCLIFLVVSVERTVSQSEELLNTEVFKSKAFVAVWYEGKLYHSSKAALVNGDVEVFKVNSTNEWGYTGYKIAFRLKK